MGLRTRETGESFADLICADPQWLDAEFDALISASFSEPPAPPRPAPPWVPPRPGYPCQPSRRPAPGLVTVTPPVTRPDLSRERSPPAHLPSRLPDRCS